MGYQRQGVEWCRLSLLGMLPLKYAAADMCATVQVLAPLPGAHRALASPACLPHLVQVRSRCACCQTPAIIIAMLVISGSNDANAGLYFHSQNVSLRWCS
jgi:hypothetical protein